MGIYTFELAFFQFTIVWIDYLYTFYQSSSCFRYVFMTCIILCTIMYFVIVYIFIYFIFVITYRYLDWRVFFKINLPIYACLIRIRIIYYRFILFKKVFIYDHIFVRCNADDHCICLEHTKILYIIPFTYIVSISVTFSIIPGTIIIHVCIILTPKTVVRFFYIPSCICYRLTVNPSPLAFIYFICKSDCGIFIRTYLLDYRSYIIIFAPVIYTCEVASHILTYFFRIFPCSYIIRHKISMIISKENSWIICLFLFFYVNIYASIKLCVIL